MKRKKVQNGGSNRMRRKNGKLVVKLASRKIPDWVVERWLRRVGAFFRRLRRKSGVSLDALEPVSGMTREGWRKFERGSKHGPLFATILRAAHALCGRSWRIVITAEGPQIERLR